MWSFLRAEQSPVENWTWNIIQEAPAHWSTGCMRAHGGDVKLMTHRQEDTCRLLQKWHVKCAGHDVDARDGEGLPLLQTPCGGWKNTLVDVTPCYSIHPLSLSVPSLCTPLNQHLWPRHRERDIGSGVQWGTLFSPSPPPTSPPPPPLSFMNETVWCSTSKGGTSVYPGFFFLCLHLLHM